MVASIDGPKDKELIYSCKKLRVPVVALVHSWDNLPGQGYLSCKPDRLLVWNEQMAQEAETLHGIDRDHIDIVGGPKYELYRRCLNGPFNQRFAPYFREIFTWNAFRTLAGWSQSNYRLEHALNRLSK